MPMVGTGTKACLLGSSLLFGSPLVASAAEYIHPHPVSSHVHQVSSRAVTYHSATYRSSGRHPAGVGYATLRGHHGTHAAGHSWGISCVPYARQVSGIQVAGNAWQWWDNAAGQYARGNRPEPGSILNFRANARMRLGHVAVVTQVVNAREVIVDQANWPSAGMRGGVSRDVAIVEVSEANNWSAVRVALGRGSDFGSVYPTYGFIYNRADNGIVTASINRPAPQPSINPVPSDLRPVAERPWRTVEEVAESPATPRRRINLQVIPVMDRGGR